MEIKDQMTSLSYKKDETTKIFEYIRCDGHSKISDK